VIFKLSEGEGSVDKEIGEGWVWLDGTEAGRVLREATSRGAIGWVACTWDVSGVKGAAGFFSEDMEAAKSSIDMSVARSALVPSFDDDSVVTVDAICLVSAMLLDDCMGHELEGN